MSLAPSQVPRGQIRIMSKSPGRTPPKAVLTALRQEVEFHCPVPVDDGVCGNPYLTWHHFDPPWRVEHHHRVEGMIALCQQHAAKADNGSYSDDQLRRFKREVGQHRKEISGRFEWMRRDLIAFVGGTFFARTPIVLELDGQPLVWFTRNEHQEWMLNFRMTPLSSPKTKIIDNVWHVPPTDVGEILCPPHGRTVDVRYVNGDHFRTEFREIRDVKELLQRFPAARASFDGVDDPDVEFPVAVVSITHVAADAMIKLYPDRTETPGNNTIGGGWIENCGVGIKIESPLGLPTPDQLAALMRFEMERRSYGR